MRKIAVMAALVLLGAVCVSSIAFGVDNMIIRFKNGRTQNVNLDQVQSIEFQRDQASSYAPPSGIHSGRTYQLIVKHSRKCLDIEGVATHNGANAYQWDCHGGGNQQWTLTDKGGGYYLAKVKHSGKCLDVSGPSTANGANIYQWDCHGGDNQLWQFIPQGQGYYLVMAKHSGKCLDVAGAGKGNSDNVHQWDCHGGESQLWQLK